MAKFTLLPDEEEPQQKYALLPDDEEAAVPQQGYLERQAGLIGRNVGLTGRILGTGALSLPNLGADAINKIINLGIEQYNKHTKSKVPFLPMASATTQKVMTAAGVPQAETATERVVQAAGAGMAGAVFGAGVGGAIPGAVGRTMAANPGTQALSAAASGASAQGAKEAGGGPAWQLGAGLAGGMAAPLAVGVAKAVPRTVGGLIKPFTAEGKQKIVGDVMTDLAHDPVAARTALAENVEMVPGAMPTTAQASKDLGLAATERTLRSQGAGSRFTERTSQNNNARTILLSGMAKDSAAIEVAKTARDAASTPMREAAFAKGKPVDMSDVDAKLGALIKGPSGKQEVVGKALTWLEGRLKGETDPERLYSVRKDIGLAMEGKLAGDNQVFRLAKKELLTARKALDAAIEKSAPGFQEYLDRYRADSAPINELATLQDVSGRVVNAGTDQAGNQLLSQAKWFNVVTKNREELSKVLTKEQMGNLGKIGKDLDAGAFAETAGRAVGSNTYQNLSTANIIGAALGGKASTPDWLRTIMRPIAWVYQVPDARMQELLADAMLDPVLAKTLLFKATPKNVMTVGQELLRKFKAAELGSAAGIAAQPAQPVNHKQ